MHPQEQPTPKLQTVLIIEDEEHVRLVVEYNLKLHGFEVYQAEDGPTGLNLARENKPDLILLDWMLPELDGLEVLAELKRDGQTAGIPVIMLTAKGIGSDIYRAYELGADDYIVKPFAPKQLTEIIKDKLAEKVGVQRK